jgi:hypothetical protein
MLFAALKKVMAENDLEFYLMYINPVTGFHPLLIMQKNV